MHFSPSHSRPFLKDAHTILTCFAAARVFLPGQWQKLVKKTGKIRQ